MNVNTKPTSKQTRNKIKPTLIDKQINKTPAAEYNTKKQNKIKQKYIYIQGYIPFSILRLSHTCPETPIHFPFLPYPPPSSLFTQHEGERMGTDRGGGTGRKGGEGSDGCTRR